MDYPVQGSAQQRIRTRHLTLINENALPQSYALYKKEIINRFNLTYDLNFIFTNKDNKQEYITNENEYKHFIAINKTIPIKVEVEYDDYLDVVTLNGKMYLPADSKIAIKSYAAESVVKEELVEKPECEEELVTGSTLYTYLFMVLCK